jgi:hypothetical protein
VLSNSWKLLGPLETANGLLMFGVSTAMIFGIMQHLVQARFGSPDIALGETSEGRPKPYHA